MLHLRVVCPPHDTDSVTTLLRADSGTAHLVVTPGGATQPTGDVIEAEIARESADGILDRLTKLELARAGEISLYTIDTLESDTAEAAERTAPGHAADAVIWDELVATTGEEAQLNGTFLAFLTVACLLAAVGVLTGSAITIVGAMVVGPDFGPLAALAVAAIGKRRGLAARAGLALAAGYPLAMLATAVLALLARAAGLFDPARLVQSHVATFIYQVGPYSVVVALLAGVAGMLALTSEKSGILIGVFISVTTVPAAGFAALAAVADDWSRCGEALVQLLVNLVGITVAGTVTLFIRRHRIPQHLRRRTRRARG
jgi:uncharacterized hydrophobic protein (TIGR00271 family)